MVSPVTSAGRYDIWRGFARGDFGINPLLNPNYSCAFTRFWDSFIPSPWDLLMKTNIPGASVAAALLCLTPLFSVAQNIPSSPSVNRNLDRLTLLPGPYLLSPARTTPTMMPSPVKLGAAPLFNFVPAPGSAASPSSGKIAIGEGAPPASSISIPAALPPPESLRFEAKLESPVTPPKIEFRLRRLDP
jgi:hypothetical protein